MSTNFDLHTAVPDPMSKSQFEALLRNLIPNAELAGDGLTVAANKLVLDLASGGGLEFSGGKLQLDMAGAGIGRVLQVVEAQTQTQSDITAAWNATPEITHGVEVLSLAITPQRANSRIVVLASLAAGYSDVEGNAGGGAGIFRTDTDALVTGSAISGNSHRVLNLGGVMRGVVETGDTDEVTFKLRAGVITGTLKLNSSTISGGSPAGYKVTTWMQVMEVRV
jgi:hypothetical protein